MVKEQVIITFSHLRWNFVYQRPQHLLSRLARKRRVYFIEEPVHDPSGVLSWERNEPEENVAVLRPHTPVANSGFNDEQTPHLMRLIGQLVEEEKLQDYLVWFYTPMALPLADTLKPAAVIYDCMDELSAFLGAPPQLLQQEERLLQQADLVFTGGPSLFRAKQHRHPNVHCFPSSVDAAHFAQAKHLPEAADQAPLPHPRLGFFGVIDERMDLGLLDALSQAHPEWQIIMVGPVVKVDPASLPQRPNLHFLGQRSYGQLPEYLAGWDACLLPFAQNEATRFISPTKILEYMAADRPIVSTPIMDVADPYGQIVHLGDTHADFIAACERALAWPDAERVERVAKMRDVLSKTSWDSTAGAMEQQIAKTLERSGRTASPDRMGRTIVIGAGPTGLSAAYHLGEDAVLIEQNDRVGGWCRSIEDRGFTFDYAGHIMFSNDAYVHELYKMLLGDNVHWQDREAWIYSKDVYTRYPFQGSLYGLPPAVIKECIVGAIEARFGAIRNPKVNGGAANGKTKNGSSTAVCKAESITDCCGDGIMESTAQLGTAPATEPRNFEEFIYKVWGAGIAKHFAIPYNRKLWSVPLTEMETSWLGGRVPLPDLEEMIAGALHPAPKPMGPNARFGYPLRGGFQSLMNAFLPHLKGDLLLNTRVVRVSPKRRTVTLSDGKILTYEYLISTMPLPVLVRIMGEEAPAEVRAAAEQLRNVSVRCVNLGIGREQLTEKHWIYYPEDTVFHRIFVQGNASPFCNPSGGFGLTCEITYSPAKPLPCDGDELIRRCIEDCHKVGMFKPEDPVWAANQVDLPYAYVVYDHARPSNVKTISDWMAEQDIILEGRYSEWQYYNSDHAFLAGKKGAAMVRELQSRRSAAQSLPAAFKLGSAATLDQPQ
jgi:UDP-galactopyranose mutase